MPWFARSYLSPEEWNVRPENCLFLCPDALCRAFSRPSTATPGKPRFTTADARNGHAVAETSAVGATVEFTRRAWGHETKANYIYRDHYPTRHIGHGGRAELDADADAHDNETRLDADVSW